MAGARIRRLQPLRQQLIASLGIPVSHDITEPVVEALGCGFEAAAETTHVVKAHPAADDENALIAKRCKRPAGGQMKRRVEAFQERHLHHRNRCLGIDQEHRNENPMIEAAITVRL
jgi:hypothetical protein